MLYMHAQSCKCLVKFGKLCTECISHTGHDRLVYEFV